MRAEMRLERQRWLEQEVKKTGVEFPKDLNSETVNSQSKSIKKLDWLAEKAKDLGISIPSEKNENLWYGHEAIAGKPNSTTESLVKFEYASILWLPVFCPGQPIVWVTCPRWLKRYQRLAGIKSEVDIYSGSRELKKNKLFFNFGFLTIDHPQKNLTDWFPDKQERPAVVVKDDDIAMIHDMALYRQTRIAMEEDQKLVKNFFGLEALPEETILVFPIAHRKDEKGHSWHPFSNKTDIYIGGMESIGFGHCELTLKGV
jgi:CRISPR-associated protein Cmr4